MGKLFFTQKYLHLPKIYVWVPEILEKNIFVVGYFAFYPIKLGDATQNAWVNLILPNFGHFFCPKLFTVCLSNRIERSRLSVTLFFQYAKRQARKLLNAN